MAHTPEPWVDTGDAIADAAGRIVAELDCDVFGRWDEDRARIVACVNACAGIPTDKLRPGIVKELWDAARVSQSDGDVNAIWAATDRLSALLRELGSE